MCDPTLAQRSLRTEKTGEKTSRPSRSRRLIDSSIIPTKLLLSLALLVHSVPSALAFCELSYRVLDEFGGEVNVFRPGGTFSVTCRGDTNPTLVASHVPTNQTHSNGAVTYNYKIGYGEDFWKLMPPKNTLADSIYCNCGYDGIEYLVNNWQPNYYLCEFEDCQQPCDSKKVCVVSKNKHGKKEALCTTSPNCVPHSSLQNRNHYKVACLRKGMGAEENECMAFGDGESFAPRVEIISDNKQLCPDVEIYKTYYLGKTQILKRRTHLIRPFSSCGTDSTSITCQLFSSGRRGGQSLEGNCEKGWKIDAEDVRWKGKVECTGEGRVQDSQESVQFRWYNYILNGLTELDCGQGNAICIRPKWIEKPETAAEKDDSTLKLSCPAEPFRICTSRVQWVTTEPTAGFCEQGTRLEDKVETSVVAVNVAPSASEAPVQEEREEDSSLPDETKRDEEFEKSSDQTSQSALASSAQTYQISSVSLVSLTLYLFIILLSN